MRRIAVISTIALSTALLVTAELVAQGTVADYQRAIGLRERYESLTVNVPQPATWIEKTSRFWYRKSVPGGTEFVLVDAMTQQKKPPFDHQRLADALSAAIKPEKKYTPVTLPFTAFTFAEGDQAIEVTVQNEPWRCRLTDYTCERKRS